MVDWLNNETYNKVIQFIRQSAKDLSGASVSARDNVGVLNPKIKSAVVESLNRAAKDLENFNKIKVDVTKKTKEYPRS